MAMKSRTKFVLKVQVLIVKKKKVPAHPATFENGTLWSVFNPSLLMWSAPMNVFHVKREFHSSFILPSVLQLSTAQQWPSLLSNLDRSFFPALYASSSLSFHSFHPFVPLHFHLVHPLLMPCLGWVPACSHSHRETLPLWQILCPEKKHWTENNKWVFRFHFN